MSDTPETADAAQEGAQVQEPQPVVATKTKAKPTGDLIVDTAAEVENLSKTKALNLADKLAQDIDNNSFRLGGVLHVIYTNSWFEGFDSFDTFVFERFGFQGRKARYLMSIYDGLVTKQIPWEKVQALGWTKLKDLVSILTAENVDEWVAKAKDLTVVQLQAMLKATPNQESEGTTKTTSDTSVKKFILKNDQIDTVNSALAKAKADAGTEFDNVALERLCTAYLSDTGGQVDLTAAIKQAGIEDALKIVSELWPEYDITVKAAGEAEEAAAG